MAKEQLQGSIKAKRVFDDYLLMLIAPCFASVFYYGKTAFLTILVCAVTGFVFDFAASVLVYKKYFVNDRSAVCASLMIAMMLPADMPIYIPFFACAFAVLAVKIPFGGGMRAPFVPAAAGFAFIATCFKDTIFTYSGGKETMMSPISKTLALGGSVRLNLTNVIDILTGNVLGAIGTSCVVIFLACILFLFVRRSSALYSTFGFLFTVAILSLIFPRSNGSVLASPILEITSGSLLFASVFLITDYSTLPKHRVNRVVYGAFCGIICMAMRHLGAFEEPVCFAVLLANAFTPLLDIGTDKAISKLFPKRGVVLNE